MARVCSLASDNAVPFADPATAVRDVTCVHLVLSADAAVDLLAPRPGGPEDDDRGARARCTHADQAKPSEGT
jgi:hypothetical protein